MQINNKLVWVLPFIFILNVSTAQSVAKDSTTRFIKITIPYQSESIFSIGLKANMNYAHQDNPYIYGLYYGSFKSTSANNFIVSPVFEWQFLKHFSIGIEPTYVRSVARGFDDFNRVGEYLFGREPKNIELKISYAMLPVLLKMRIPILKNKILVTSEIGWSGSWLLSGNRTFTNDFGSWLEPFDENIYPILNRFDYGLNLGIGVSIPFKKGYFDINSRFYYGLRDVVTFYESRNQINTYQFGYRFILK